MASPSTAADGDKPYIVQLAQAWVAFRVHELRAAAEAAGVRLQIDDESALRPDGMLLPIRVPDEASVVRLAARAVLAKGFVEVWASGDSWDELAEELLRYPRDAAAPYLAEGTPTRERSDEPTPCALCPHYAVAAWILTSRHDVQSDSEPLWQAAHRGGADGPD